MNESVRNYFITRKQQLALCTGRSTKFDRI
jgi:hypothetical protein